MRAVRAQLLREFVEGLLSLFAFFKRFAVPVWLILDNEIPLPLYVEPAHGRLPLVRAASSNAVRMAVKS